MSASRKRAAEPRISQGSKIAFFGPTTLLAREIRSLLDSRGFLTRDVKLFGEAEQGALDEFGGEPLVVTLPDEETIVDLDIAFMCGGVSETTRYLGWAERRGFIALDLSGASRGRSGVESVHAEVNPEAMDPEAHVIASPHAVAHNLASLIAGARLVGQVARVEALALRPASDMGEAAIRELHEQTVGLLNFASVPQEVFGRQLAFNVLPSQSLPQSRAEDFDLRIREEVAGILRMEAARLTLTSAFVPVFHGHVLFIAVTFERPVEAAALAAALGTAKGLRVVDDPARFSPVELAGEEGVAVLSAGDVRGPEDRFTFWTFCDNLKGGAALNAVKLAERISELRGVGP